VLTADGILDRLKTYVREDLELGADLVERVTLETRVVEGLQLDSLRQVMLVARIEEDYGFEFDAAGADELDALASVGDLVRLIQRRAARPEVL
jgi:acyl carrier protein